jgi:hypothetical protein
MVQRFPTAPSALLHVDEPTGERALYTSKTWFSMSRRLQRFAGSGGYTMIDEALGQIAQYGGGSGNERSSESQQVGRIRYRAGDCTNGVLDDRDQWSATSIPRIVFDLANRLLASLAHELADAGPIHYYYWLPESMMLICQFKGKYCYLAQRQHSSNHAMLVLGLREAPRYWHKCNSQSCPADTRRRPIEPVSTDAALADRVRELRESHERAQERSFASLFAALSLDYRPDPVSQA